MVRTCIGCTRKAFLPPTSTHGQADPVATEVTPWLPDAARGWVVEELLKAVRRCLFCGNRFVSVI